jgi:uncharacterized repeat protein (TIGR01451 family)
MSKFSITILASLGMITTTLIALNFPLQVQARTRRNCIDPLPITKRVTLTLKADKKVIKDNKTIFEPIAGKASVKPGDIIMYTVVAKNNSRCPLKNLILKQPIPKGTNYLKDSAMVVDGAELLFSIDGGKTFVAKPMVGKEIAPAADYNYLRWKFIGKMVSNAQVKTSYKLQVK